MRTGFTHEHDISGTARRFAWPTARCCSWTPRCNRWRCWARRVGEHPALPGVRAINKDTVHITHYLARKLCVFKKLHKAYAYFACIPYYVVLYMQTPYYVVLFMQSGYVGPLGSGWDHLALLGYRACGWDGCDDVCAGANPAGLNCLTKQHYILRLSVAEHQPSLLCSMCV